MKDGECPGKTPSMKLMLSVPSNSQEKIIQEVVKGSQLIGYQYTINIS